jgi:hypothetical protein
LFSKKLIFSKIFFGVWLAQKNYEMRKSEFGKCRRNPTTSGCRCWIPARLFLIQPDSIISGQILAVLARSVAGSVQILPAFDHGRNPAIFRLDSGASGFLAIGCCRISTTDNY